MHSLSIDARFLPRAVANTFKAFDPCEIDSSKCDDFLDQPDNAKALREGKGNNYRE